MLSGVDDLEFIDGPGEVEPPPAPSAADLLALTASCEQVSSGLYRNARDPVPEPSIPVCALEGAYFWQAGMGIDCDGLSHDSPECPSEGAHTAATDSTGQALDSLTLPFVVVPAATAVEGCPGVPWSYEEAGLAMGSVVAVVYRDQLAYGVLGDVGPCDAIGMASHAMAKRLGINVEPGRPGVDSGVTYFAFSGPDAIVSVIEDQAQAAELGEQRAAELLAAP
jgi:hypothetical protein